MGYYLYGLQRSGTTVIHEFLKKNYEITFDNIKVGQLVPGSNNKKIKTNSPFHKHFRLYDNKKIIPQTKIDKCYYNEYIINSLEDLDNLLGDHNHVNKYVVIYKDIFSWLPSIEKWAKRVNWKTVSKMDFIDDYLNYIIKWYSIKNNRVIFISYHEFLNISCESLLANKLSDFFKKKPNKLITCFKKVDCSYRFTIDNNHYYINQEYMNSYSSTELDFIKGKPLYIEIMKYNLY